MNKKDEKARKIMWIAVNKVRDEALKDRKRVWNPEAQQYEFEPKLVDVFRKELGK
jgi:hypothetical protein